MLSPVGFIFSQPERSANVACRSRKGSGSTVLPPLATPAAAPRPLARASMPAAMPSAPFSAAFWASVPAASIFLAASCSCLVASSCRFCSADLPHAVAATRASVRPVAVHTFDISRAPPAGDERVLLAPGCGLAGSGRHVAAAGARLVADVLGPDLELVDLAVEVLRGEAEEV